MRLHPAINRDLVSGIILALAGWLFFVSAGSIGSTEEGLVGPAFVPRIVSGLLMVFGAILGAGSVIGSGRTRMHAPTPDEPLTDPEKDLDAGIAVRSFLLIGIGFLFVFLFTRVGFAATAMATIAASLLIFGERRPVRLVLVSVIGPLGFT